MELLRRMQAILYRLRLVGEGAWRLQESCQALHMVSEGSEEKGTGQNTAMNE